MFTGIVQAIGTVKTLVKTPSAQLTLAVPRTIGRAPKGASICVSGVCLTLVRKGPGSVSFNLSSETLSRTTLGTLTHGKEVNVERSLRLGDEFGGHFVMGHVDARARVKKIKRSSTGVQVAIDLPRTLASLVVEKGSVAVDGVSLTINRVKQGVFEVMLIPHTLYTTTLKSLEVGDAVNLEADVMARYCRRVKDFSK